MKTRTTITTTTATAASARASVGYRAGLKPAAWPTASATFEVRDTNVHANHGLRGLP